MSNRSSTLRKVLVAGAVVTGASFGAAGIASAATSSSTTNKPGSSNSTAPAGGTYGAPPNPGQVNPAALAHGPDETLLTGTNLQKALAAAKAAVPGATVIRAETDSSGASTYEVHVKKADGTYATVELDSTFNVVRTIPGFGAGPAGGQPPRGGAPSSNAA
jgi:Peptidase propeptide and YPEB domain